MRLRVDSRPVEVTAGATVLDAVNRLGIPLPQLCKDPDRPRAGDPSSKIPEYKVCAVRVEPLRATASR